MTLRKRVLRDGALVQAAGQVIAVDGAVWFQPPLPQRLVKVVPPRPPQPDKLAIPAQGVDLDELSDVRRVGGALQGSATLTGNWSGGRLYVTAQSPPAWPPRYAPAWHRTPCPPPAGGWPQVDQDFFRGVPEELRRSGAIVHLSLRRPSPTQAVLVVAAAQAAEVEQALRPLFGASICVVPSRWTRSYIDSIRHHLDQHWDPWLIYTSGETSDDDGQLRIGLQLVHVRPGLAAWADTLPDSPLLVEAWLRPHQ
jgi:hypothetical protein